MNIEKIMEITGLSQKEIKKMIEEKKKGFKGLVSEDGALALTLFILHFTFNLFKNI